MIEVEVKGLFCTVEGEEFVATVRRRTQPDGYGGFSTLHEMIADLRRGLNRSATEPPPNFGSEGGMIAFMAASFAVTDDGEEAYWRIIERKAVTA